MTAKDLMCMAQIQRKLALDARKVLRKMDLGFVRFPFRDGNPPISGAYGRLQLLLEGFHNFFMHDVDLGIGQGFLG